MTNISFYNIQINHPLPWRKKKWVSPVYYEGKEDSIHYGWMILDADGRIVATFHKIQEDVADKIVSAMNYTANMTNKRE